MTAKSSIFSETSYNSDSCSDYGPINGKKKDEQNEEVIQLENNSNQSDDDPDVENPNYHLNRSDKEETEYSSYYSSSFSFKDESNGPLITGKAQIGHDTNSVELPQNEDNSKNSKCCLLL